MQQLHGSDSRSSAGTKRHQPWRVLALLCIQAALCHAQDPCPLDFACYPTLGALIGVDRLNGSELNAVNVGALFSQWLGTTSCLDNIVSPRKTPITVLNEGGPAAQVFEYLNNLPWLGMSRGPPQYVEVSFVDLPAASTFQQMTDLAYPYPAKYGQTTMGPIIHTRYRDPNSLAMNLGLTGPLASLKQVPENVDQNTLAPRGLVFPRTTLMLFYRPAVLERFSISPSSLSTWTALLNAAQALHGQDFDGDRTGDWALCLDHKPGCSKSSALWAAIGASIVQTQGLSHGSYFDPDSMMSLLLEGPAATETARIYTRLMAYTQPGARAACNISNDAFTNTPGRCAFTIDWDLAAPMFGPNADQPERPVPTWDVPLDPTILAQFNLSSTAATNSTNTTNTANTTNTSNTKQEPGVPGPPQKAPILRFGAMLLPGSEVVLDRRLNALVTCTAQLCPYAVSEQALQSIASAVPPAVTPGVTPTAVTPAAPPGVTAAVTPGVTPSVTPAVTPGVTPVTTVTVLVNRAPYSSLGVVAADMCDQCDIPSGELYKATGNVTQAGSTLPSSLSPFVWPTSRDALLRDVLFQWQQSGGNAPGWQDSAALQDVAALAPANTTLSLVNVIGALPRSVVVGLIPPLLQARLHPNQAPALPFPFIHAAMEEMADSIASGADPMQALALASYKQSLAIQWADQVVASTTPALAFTLVYWRSINYSQPSAPGGGSQQDQMSSQTKVFLAVFLPVAGLLLIGALIAFLVVRHNKLRTASIGPGAGPQTTLVVATVEGGEALWDELPPEVVQESKDLLTTCLKQLLQSCRGYQRNLPEDDAAFLFAFHTPEEATDFAIAAQTALMALPWPPLLLAHPACAEVWVAQPSRTLCAKPSSGSGAGAPDLSESPKATLSLDLKISAATPSKGIMGVLSHVGLMAGNGISSASTHLQFWSASATTRASDAAPPKQPTPHHTPFHSITRHIRFSSNSSSPSRTAPSSCDPSHHNPTAAADGSDDGIAIHVSERLSTDPSSPAHHAAAAAAQRQLLREAVLLRCATAGLATEDSGSQDGGGEMHRKRMQSLSGAKLPISKSAQLIGRGVTEGGGFLKSDRGVTSMAGGAASMGGEAGSQCGLEVQGLEGKWLDELACQYGSPYTHEEVARHPACVCVFRGLRLRMGLHSGVQSTEVVYNKASNTLSYEGAAVHMAAAVAECAVGGMVLLSSEAFQPLASVSALVPKGLLPVFMGDWSLVNAPDVPHSTAQLYAIVSQETEARLPLMAPMRGTCLQLGNLDAPLGHVTIAFMYAMSASALLADLGGVASRALDTFSRVAVQATSTHKGYIVECLDGLVVAAFASTFSAVTWSLHVREVLLHHDWPPELLEHQLCEEVCAWNAESGQLEVMQRGLRLRTGLHVGRVDCHVNSRSGRLAYRGKVMNRSARIAGKAQDGQVLASRDVLSLIPDLSAQPFTSEFCGTFALKGVCELIDCHEFRPRTRQAAAAVSLEVVEAAAAIKTAEARAGNM